MAHAHSRESYGAAGEDYCCMMNDNNDQILSLIAMSQLKKRELRNLGPDQGSACRMWDGGRGSSEKVVKIQVDMMADSMADGTCCRDGWPRMNSLALPVHC